MGPRKGWGLDKLSGGHWEVRFASAPQTEPSSGASLAELLEPPYVSDSHIAV